MDHICKSLDPFQGQLQCLSEQRQLSAPTIMNLAQIASQLVQTWGTKTLEEFRCQAERETNGTLFQSLRVAGGQRLAIVMCLTDLDQIVKLEQAMKLIDSGTPEDWNTLTLGDIAIRTQSSAGFSFESRRDEFDRRSAVVLTATSPKSIQIIERIFVLPA